MVVVTGDYELNLYENILTDPDRTPYKLSEYKPRGRWPGSIPGRGRRFVSTPQRLDHLWGSPASGPTGNGGCFPWVKEDGA
jgi:hypothetical protein